jgi:hypothetical protein
VPWVELLSELLVCWPMLMLLVQERGLLGQVLQAGVGAEAGAAGAAGAAGLVGCCTGAGLA